MSDGGTTAGVAELEAALRERFDRLAALAGLDRGRFDLLDKLYSEPTRCYHGWSHIAECLREFDRVAHQLSDPVAVELALWFHDAIYTAGSCSNELDSAVLAYESIRPSDENLACKVRRFIEATDYSRVSAVVDPDLDYLKDIDFAAFGKPFDAFWRDVERLRRENGEDSHPAASDRRLAFYHSILDGDLELFRTGYFRGRLMEQALSNLRRVITLLEQSGE